MGMKIFLRLVGMFDYSIRRVFFVIRMRRTKIPLDILAEWPSDIPTKAEYQR